MGGSVSRAHDVLFRGAIYLPTLAATLAYTHLAPTDFDGKNYLALNLDAAMTWLIGFAATASVGAYLAWVLWRNHGVLPIAPPKTGGTLVHPGEWWVVLTVYHEVQYLYFTHAMARGTASFPAGSRKATGPATKDLDSQAPGNAARVQLPELKFAALFPRWPVIGFSGAILGGWLQLQWLVASERTTSTPVIRILRQRPGPTRMRRSGFSVAPSTARPISPRSCTATDTRMSTWLTAASLAGPRRATLFTAIT